MPELTYRKRLNVLRLYWARHSRQFVADKKGAAKGSVTNAVDMLRDGELPVLGVIEDQVDALWSQAGQCAPALRGQPNGLAPAPDGAGAYLGGQTNGCSDNYPAGGSAQVNGAVDSIATPPVTGVNPNPISQTQVRPGGDSRQSHCRRD